MALTQANDLARQREAIACRSGESFIAAFNATFRRGLEEPGKAQPSRARFVCGLRRAGSDCRTLSQLGNELEIEDFGRELTVSTAWR